MAVYDFVFASKTAIWVALMLCVSLLLQPVVQVQAQELDASETTDIQSASDSSETQEVEPPEATEQLPEVLDEGDDIEDIVIEDVDIADPVIEEDDVDSQTDVQSDEREVEITEEQPVVVADSVDENESAVSDDSVTQDETTTGEVTASTTQSNPESETATSTEQTAEDGADSATTTEAVQNGSDDSEPNNSETQNDSSGGGGSEPESADTEEDQATTTVEQSTDNTDEPAVDETDIATTSDAAPESASSSASTVIAQVQTDSEFSFNASECTQVEDGTFYCQKAGAQQFEANDLFAAPDATGDMEIYVTQNGEQIQITNNQTDDASPHYDAATETIVWHRLVNDRYQIVSYDVDTAEETVITDTKVNNMEPTRSGEYTVWQRWVQNNWEIILYSDGVETQLTDSVEHDIAPHVRGGMVIWNVRSSDGTQSLMTYDINSQVFNEIKDEDGVSVSNPRMLVMYEAQYQNGDTVMKGFDVVTGEIIPIERIPRELPTEIPNPEPTGQTRALPTANQTEDDQTIDSDPEPEDDDNDDIVIAEGDLVLGAASTTATSTVDSDVSVNDEFDLDLRPVESVVSTSTTIVEQAAIPDIVIPEFIPEEATEQASSTQDL